MSPVQTQDVSGGDFPVAPSPETDAAAGQGGPVGATPALEFRYVAPIVRKAIAHERRPLVSVEREDGRWNVFLAGTKQSLVIDRIHNGEVRSGIVALEEFIDFLRGGESN